MRNDKLQFQQLNEKMLQLNGLQHVNVLPFGWINARRSYLKCLKSGILTKIKI
jgi:hypothetical protein